MIGVVIVTYQRFERFKECFEALMRNRKDVNEIVVVEDCSVQDKEEYDNYFKQIMFNDVIIMRNETNLGVGPSKNRGIKYFYDKGYDYIFTLEDDINILRPDVFKKYIEVSNKTGFQYINFGLHGPLNKDSGKEIALCGVMVHIYPHIVGAFTLHTKKLIDILGFYDEKYHNAWEHVDYCFMAAEKDLTAPFGQFTDISDSGHYLQEQRFSIEDSSIRHNAEWMSNIGKGIQYFKQKHGEHALDGYVR